MRITRLLLGAMVVSLVACSPPLTPEQREAYRRAAEEQERREQEAYLAALRSRCTAYGFRPGSQPFAQCMQSEDRAIQAQKRADEERQRIQDARQREADRIALCRMGGGTNCDGRQRTTQCRRDPFGNVTCVSD